MMNAPILLAQAAEADREADAIFEAMDAARKPDRVGSRPLIPAGFEATAERASDLRRHARQFRADAAEIVQDSAPRPVAASLPSSVTKARDTTPAKPFAPTETAESVADCILNSDSAAASRASPLAPAAAETVEAISARALGSDGAEAESDMEVDAVGKRIAAA